MSKTKFNEAKLRLSELKSEPSNDVKLKLYGLYKQSTVGKCNTRKPGMTDFVGRAKWNAWNELGNMSQSEAESNYIKYVNELTGYVEISEKKGKYEQILTSIEFGNIYMLRMNRPKKYNAFNPQMYFEIIAAMKEADADPNVAAFCLTGNGAYFSSGNDQSNFMEFTDDVEAKIKAGCKSCGEYIRGFIEFSKPMIALVNGPAIGISFTVLALFDMVLASDSAWFSSPFTRLALSPEGCSSYTFPKLMGSIRASEVLLFNKKLSAKEAFECGLVTEVIESKDFEQKTMKKLEMISKLPRESLNVSRNFIRSIDKERLLEVNDKEMAMLSERFLSGEFMNSVMEFMKKRSKL